LDNLVRINRFTLNHDHYQPNAGKAPTANGRKPDVEILFLWVMKTPLAPALPPLGAGAHCDASVLPVQEIPLRLRTGNTALSQPGVAQAAGAEPQRAL